MCSGTSTQVACAAGYYCPGGSSSQTACGSDNKYSASSASSCSTCPGSPYPGQYTSGGSNTTRTTCSSCPGGYWCTGTSVITLITLVPTPSPTTPTPTVIQHCWLSAWGPWGSCSDTCSSGVNPPVHRRTKTVTQAPISPGLACPEVGATSVGDIGEISPPRICGCCLPSDLGNNVIAAIGCQPNTYLAAGQSCPNPLTCDLGYAPPMTVRVMCIEFVPVTWFDVQL